MFLEQLTFREYSDESIIWAVAHADHVVWEQRCGIDLYKFCQQMIDDLSGHHVMFKSIFSTRDYPDPFSSGELQIEKFSAAVVDDGILFVDLPKDLYPLPIQFDSEDNPEDDEASYIIMHDDVYAWGCTHGYYWLKTVHEDGYFHPHIFLFYDPDTVRSNLDLQLLYML